MKNTLEEIKKTGFKESILYRSIGKLDLLLLIILCSVVLYLFLIKNYYILSNGQTVSVTGWLWHAWGTDPDSEHGMIVPLISLGLIWWKKDDLYPLYLKRGFHYVGLILLGSFFYILGNGGGVSLFGPVALIIWILGVIGFIGGNTLFLKLLFPVGFLLFMVPWSLIGGDTITVPLRHLMVNIVIPLLNLIGIHVVKVGTAILSAPDPVLGIPAGKLFGLDVDNPCSGLRSLFALAMITALFSNLTQPTQLKKWLLFACVFPLAILGNTMRIMMLTIGSYFFGTEFAVGIGNEISFFHMFAGYMVYISALGCMFLISYLMNLTPEQILRLKRLFLFKKISTSHS
ncbi:MAG: exosortase/archaeosortase family protein [Verrucomicrobiota bacterium]|nr:exosortase/archaeosortase family protein [Verrucomicrobiota bacterium]